MAALGRLLVCLLVGVAAGIVGGYAGLKLGGSSVQTISAGTAVVSVSPDHTPGLVLMTSDPPATVTYAAWSVPLAVHVAVRSVDPTVLLGAALGSSGQRSTLVSQAKHALGSAVEHIAIAAVLGALAVGLLAAIALALALATGAWTVVPLVGVIAPLACAGVLLVAAAQMTASITTKLATPSCQLAGQLSPSGAAQALQQGSAGVTTATAIALRVACDPSFTSELQQLAGHVPGF